MVTGTVMLGGISQGGGSTTMQDVTPIARLAEDFEVIAVPADSEFETLEDLTTAWSPPSWSRPSASTWPTCSTPPTQAGAS